MTGLCSPDNSSCQICSAILLYKKISVNKISFFLNNNYRHTLAFCFVIFAVGSGTYRQITIFTVIFPYFVLIFDNTNVCTERICVAPAKCYSVIHSSNIHFFSFPIKDQSYSPSQKSSGNFSRISLYFSNNSECVFSFFLGLIISPSEE